MFTVVKLEFELNAVFFLNLLHLEIKVTLLYLHIFPKKSDLTTFNFHQLMSTNLPKIHNVISLI